jgi:hypothetical protein
MLANDEIPIRLTVLEWNQAILILQDGPYRVVRPLLDKINEQAARAEAAAAAPPLPAATNGGESYVQNR